MSKEIARQTGLKASVGLAQAALESDFGSSGLAQKYNNLFGIKAGPNEPQVLLETKEYENGEWIEIKAPFRVYKSKEDCLWAHVRLLQNGTTWNANQYQAVFLAQTVEEQVQALGSSGYATDPDYTAKLKEMIEQYQLKRFDQLNEK
ncbi:glycoside hydrolase family 73 protein [Atopobacter sp. AH10]|uniref:glycoside hydrolase family 73 protein n=1 Tax=Atopobacter sp. AH10 TaxID=2315861 RepID=UPI001315010D|nr:glucosaminidase domain-containing protein [Atopobacter sp. AH10]